MARSPATPSPTADRLDLAAMARRMLLVAIPAVVLWVLLTPAYNRFLETSTENLLNLFESPDVTRIEARDRNVAQVDHLGLPPGRGPAGVVRVTDLHFPLILLAALFLATPGVSRRRLWESFGWALLISVFFHIFLFTSVVQFLYVLRQGPWSVEQYGPVSRNLWAITKHVLDLPVKLALPFLLWAGFYADRLLPPAPPGDAASS